MNEHTKTVEKIEGRVVGISADVARVARSVEDMKAFDPGAGSYSLANVGEAVRFAELMAQSGEMVAPLFRNKPAVCLAVVMRATHWGFDPFALSYEVYQAKDGGPIGYQAKVFTAVLINAGIRLNYRFEGSKMVGDGSTLSNKGNEISKRSAKGTRKCIAFAKVDGEILEYETPELDDIPIKNSPLWVNDTDQQLSYYAGRGWARRHAPHLMMGAMAPEEVDSMRDVTPKRSGFADLGARARETVTRLPVSEKAREEPKQTVVDEALQKAMNAGRTVAGDPEAGRGDCPYMGEEVADLAKAWLAGFDEVRGIPVDEEGEG